MFDEISNVFTMHHVSGDWQYAAGVTIYCIYIYCISFHMKSIVTHNLIKLEGGCCAARLPSCLANLCRFQ